MLFQTILFCDCSSSEITLLPWTVMKHIRNWFYFYNMTYFKVKAYNKGKKHIDWTLKSARMTHLVLGKGLKNKFFKYKVKNGSLFSTMKKKYKNGKYIWISITSCNSDSFFFFFFFFFSAYNYVSISYFWHFPQKPEIISCNSDFYFFFLFFLI